jgi:hypothetical protein
MRPASKIGRTAKGKVAITLIFNPLGGRSATVKITFQTSKDVRKANIDYFSITREVSG